MNGMGGSMSEGMNGMQVDAEGNKLRETPDMLLSKLKMLYENEL